MESEYAVHHSHGWGSTRLPGASRHLEKQWQDGKLLS